MNRKKVGRILASLMFVGLLLANTFLTAQPVFAPSGLVLKWNKSLGAYAHTFIGPLAADINGDGKTEIVVTGGTSDPYTDGTVTALDGSTGTVIWQVRPGNVGEHTPFEICDINKDGIKEIIVSGNFPVVLFGNNGSVYWSNPSVWSYHLNSPVLDIDGDGYFEIFVSSGLGPWNGFDYFTVLSYDGKILRQAPISWHPCWGGLTIGDANFDGRFELYQGDRSYNYNPGGEPYSGGGKGLRSLDPYTLTPLWNDADILCSSHAPILADVDKDGVLDVIATHQGTGNGGLVVLDSSSGSVVTTGGKYRKGLSLGLPSHSQPTVYDIDGDGNLEILTCRSTVVKIWDLYDWKLDAILDVSVEPPKIGDVTGDGIADIIEVTMATDYTYIYSFDAVTKQYSRVETLTGLLNANAFTLVQDVDGDLLNELILTSSNGYVYCYDTPAPVSTPPPRSGLQYYSERHCGAAEYVPPPGPQYPVVSDPAPSDGATNVPIGLSQLGFTLTDLQYDTISYTVTTSPNIGAGSDIGRTNGRYFVPISNLNYATTYSWTVSATDGQHSKSRTFTFATQSPPPWWNTAWAYRKTITIDHTKVSGDQTDFPIVVDLVDSGLSGKAQLDGDDFVFIDVNQAKLSHEIEEYDHVAGHLTVWVRIPLLSASVDTNIIMYYGNPTCGNQQDPTVVWDTNNKLVLHLDETHECRLWGMIADTLPHDEVLSELITATASLKKLGGGPAGSNDDGWALVYYTSSVPVVTRGFPPAYTDPNFDLAANALADSGAWLGVGHVRARSQGGLPPWGDPHPFMRFKNGKWWAFAHNGNMDKAKLKTLIGPAYLAANPPTYGANWDSTDVVDSDLYSLFVLKCIEANNWDVVLGIAQAIKDLTDAGDNGAANFLLTDGETLWGFRRGNTLYYYQDSYYAIASQPPDTSQPGWIQLSDYNLITLTKESPPFIIADIRTKYPSPLLVDSELSNSVDSADLRANGAGQDWYESRNDLPTLLFLDTNNVGGDTSKKAGFTADNTKNAYLTQEFGTAQTGTFTAQWDIYVDSIVDLSGTTPDRAGFMLIGRSGTGGPNRNDPDRFVFLAFFKNGGGTSGTMDLVAMSAFNTYTTVAAGLSMKQWYTIRVAVNVPAGTYDVYLDGVFKATKNACNATLGSVTHISFAQWNDGAGAFYVDNVYTPSRNRYKLAVDSSGSGSVASSPGESSYLPATVVTLTATADAGWAFSSWSGDLTGSANPTTITVNTSKIVTAIFTSLGHTLTINTVGSGSVSKSPDQATYTTGTVVTLTAVPDLGWSFSGWSGDLTGSTNPTTITMDGNKVVTATFTQNQYTLTVNKVGSGSVTKNPNKATYTYGEIATLTASGEAGWLFASWSGDLTGSVNPATITIDGNKVVTANFIEGYTLTTGIVGSGSIVRSPDQAGYTQGSVVTLTAVPTVGWSFSGWSGDATGTANPVTITMTADKSVTATFTQNQYTLTINILGGGSVTKNPNKATYTYGENVTLTATADSGWAFSNFSCGCDNPFTMTIDGDIVVTATFARLYTLIVGIVGSGSATKSPDQADYIEGSVVTLTAVPSAGWSFSGWSGDLSGSANPTTITMTSNKVVTATFTASQYTLTVNVVGSGSVTKNPSKLTYIYGEIVTLTASPNVGWSFLGWSGDLSGSANPATITIAGNMVVTATFVQGTICFDSTANGNNGALYGGVTQGAVGKMDGAYRFDGTSGYVEVPHTNMLSGFTQSFTTSFWLRLEDVSRRQTLIGKYNSATGQKGWFVEFAPVDRPTWPLGFYASQDGATYKEWCAPFAPTAGTWYYITVVWQTNVVPKFYVNGVQVATIGTGTLASIYNNVGTPLHIGRCTYNAARYIKGSLDEIRISNVVRTAGWTLTCYNNQKTPSAFYAVGTEESLPPAPFVLDPNPANGAADVPVTSAELSFTLTDYQNDAMDYDVSTTPDIGSGSATGVHNGRFSIPISGLQYSTTYTWHVHVTDGTHETDATHTFTTASRWLVDSELSDSIDSDDLRTNSPSQDWYESRGGWSGGVPTLLFLDTNNVGGDTSKKAGFTASSGGNAYLTQEFSTPQTGTLTAQWDIYVDSILDISSPDRTGFMLIGADLDNQKGPSSADSERFVFLSFFKNGGGTSGTMDLVAMSAFSTYTTVASGLNLKQWYTIRVAVNVPAGTYDIYVDGVFKATKNAATKLASLTHISFAQWNDGAGAFYVDNVYSPPQDRYRLATSIVGSGSVATNPGEATYLSGTIVTLTASPSSGWYFDAWSGDVSGNANPTTVKIDRNKAVTATFTQGYSLTVNIAGSGSVSKNPDQTAYTPGSVVTLTATPAVGSFFSGWSGDLSGTANPTTITMTSSKTVTATFTQNQYTLTVNTVGSGSVTKSPDQPSYTEGSVVTLTASPAVGWSFSGWSGDLSGTANPTTITMTSNKTVTATFTQNQYTLTVNIDGGGSVVKTPDQPTYTYGTIVQLTAIPEPGYAFSQWTGDLSGNLNPNSITMTGNKIVTAVFIWTQTNWWNPAWQYRRTITINHQKVSVDQTNFPVLIDLTDSGLILKAQTDGDDFVFTDANQAKLSHEIEIYESSTGHLVAWVKIPLLSSTTDVVLYMYYGNPSSANQQDTSAVWDSSDKMVLHIDEKTGIHYDSTTNGNNGTPYNGVTQGVAGKIDGADVFDGVNDYVEVPHGSTISGFAQSFTVSFWLRLDDVSRRQTLIGKYNSGTGQKGWFIEFNRVDRPTWPLGFYASQDGATYKEWCAPFAPSAGTWYYITIVWQTNVVPKFYVNGAQVATIGTGTLASIYNNVGTPLHIGRCTYNAARYLKGSLDEIRLSNPARSASWILTCYNSQSNPSTFYQIGTEEKLEAPRYTLTITVAGQGSVTKNPDQITYLKDTVVQLTANAVPGWTFSGWSGDLTGTTNPTSITMDANKAITATFTQDQYTLTLTVVGNGQINKNPDQATYTYGTVVTLTVAPSAGWSFTGWSGDLGGSTNPMTITMTGNKEVTATFTQLEYTLAVTVDPSEGGSVTVSPAGPYHYGDIVQLTAVPTTDWYFAGWSGDLTGNTSPTTITMDNNKAVTATFIKIGYTLTINVVGSGSVTISPEQPTYAPGSVVTLTAVPAVGWSFSGWSGDLAGTANPGTVTMDGNKSITATFTQDQYTLSITLDGNGQVSKSPDQTTYTYGTIVTLTATADPGWTFSGWSGDLSGSTNPTTITMDSNKGVTATFTANQYTLTINTVGSGSVTKSPEQSTYTYNAVVTLTATPQAGWLFSQWSGDLTGSTNPATITITGNKVVTATFIRLLVDSEFTDSVDSADLRANGAGQDWYESRNNVPTLLFLDTSDIGGNTGKKAGFTASSSGNAYLSQEFISPQTGTFSAQWDIYVDSILDISGTDATGWMMIGDDSTPSSPGPNYPTAERFVYMAFYRNGGGTSGSMELFCRQRGTDTRTTIATLNLDQWYTIKVVVNVAAGTYDVYVDGAFMGTYTSRNAKTSVTHISFAQWNDGAGAFYVDNVHSPALDRYKLTVSTVGSGSVTRIPGESTYAAGSVVTLTATPASGWSFSGWSDDLTGTDNPAVLTMNSNKNVTAHFSQTEYSLTLTVSPEDSGSVSLNQTSPYHYGDIVELTAVPTAGWAFSSWTGDLTGTLSPMVITIDANKSVIVHFTQLQYSLTATISPEGSGSVSLNNSGPYYYGDKVELTATPEVGWNFFGWSGALSGSTNPEAITMDSDKSVTATFTQGQYSLTVTVSPVEGGSVSLNSTGPYNYGDWVELTAVPATGWSFEQWSGALSGTANPSTILIDGNKFVTAHFAQIEYSLNVTVNPEGSGSVSLNQTTPYHYGDKIELTAVPGSGWSFSQWSGDLAISDNPVVLTIDGNKTVAANFVNANRAPIIDTYNPATDPTIYEGDSQKFNATYHDEDGDTLTVQWLLNGSSVGSSNEYTFTADYSASGTYNVTFVVSDGKLSAKHEWKLTVVDVGPTLLMPFDSDQSPIAIDKSGYGNNGTIYGATWVSDYGGCYFFNATKYNYIVIPDAASLDGAGTWTEITIAFWIKPTIDNKAVRLVEKRSAGNSYQIGFQTTPSPGVTGNQLYWDVWTTVGYKEIVAPFGLVTGAWSHVVCTYKNGTGMAIYVNSTVAVSASHTGNITDSTCPLNIGRYGAGNSSYFTGFMDDIRLYTKALPTSLIQKHYTETQLPHADYTLTTTTIGSGSVTVSPPMSKYPYDTTVTLTAVPSAGWSFSSWSGDLTGTANPAIITMDNDKVVTATFTANQHTLIVTVEGQGTVELVPSGGIYTYGTVVTLTAAPATGWTFAGWNGDLSGNTNPTTITMDGNKAVTATFTENPQNEYTLTVNIVGTGSVTKNPDQPTYTEGAVVTLTANPATGWSFSGWSVDLSGNVNPTTITMDNNKVVTATFTQNQYTLIVSLVGNGQVTKNPDQPTYTYDTVVTLTATADLGWSFSGWSGDLSGSTNPTTITMTGDKAVTATFTQDQYTLTVNIVGSGSVAKDPDQATYTYGATVQLTATPATGWTFSSWSGDYSGSTNLATITMDKSKSVTATFLQILLTDSNFDTSVDNATLRANGAGQDWYESRGQNASLLTLDTADVGGNSGKKARLTGGTNAATDNIYLTQEFISPQTGIFSVQWDIYVNQILDISSPDRSGWMLIGDDSTSGSGPNAANGERFVYMAFFKNGGGTSGTMDLVAVNRTGSFTSHWVIASGLSLKQWYTIKVVVNVPGGTYDVYVDGILQKAGVSSRIAKTSVTHISFAQWNDGAGTFYVDNVFSPAVDTYKLAVNTDGHGSVIVNPGESSYVFGTVVTLTPIADSGYVFDHWEVNGVPVGSDEPYLVTMDSNKIVTAFFRTQ